MRMEKFLRISLQLLDLGKEVSFQKHVAIKVNKCINILYPFSVYSATLVRGCNF